MSVGGSEDNVTLDLGVDDLSDDVLVGESDDETVLGAVVLVLGLCDETLSGVEVGLALSIGSQIQGQSCAFRGMPVERQDDREDEQHR